MDEGAPQASETSRDKVDAAMVPPNELAVAPSAVAVTVVAGAGPDGVAGREKVGGTVAGKRARRAAAVARRRCSWGRATRAEGNDRGQVSSAGGTRPKAVGANTEIAGVLNMGGEDTILLHPFQSDKRRSFPHAHDPRTEGAGENVHEDMGSARAGEAAGMHYDRASG